jgi:hypothetical protein
MKTLVRIAITGSLLLFAFTNLQVNGSKSIKTGEGGKPIPENIMKIAEKSCVNCHTEPGNFMAISHLDLSNWNKYSASKQASKAKAMCKMVTKGKMPPKKFRAEHPEGVPSQEEVDAICKWAESLQEPKK